MKINVEFNSTEELLEFVDLFLGDIKVTPELLPEIVLTEPKHDENATKVETKVENPSDWTTCDVKEEPKANTVTKEMVRDIISKVMKAGKGSAVKELVKKYGASKVPDIKEEDYEAIYKEAEALL